MLNQRTVQILINAKNKASPALKQVGRDLQGLSKSAQLAVVPMGALAAVGTALIATTTLTAARTEELGVVVDNLGRVAGISQDELDTVEESIKDLGITTQGARTIMSRFMGAQLDLADATKIARAAQDLAVIGMKDSSEAAEDLTYAIASMQPRILRQYGIFVNLNDVYKKTAATLGKTVEELTEAEKRQGMLNSVVAAAAPFVGTYDAAMSTAGKQLRSFRRYTEEISNEIGERFLPFLEEAISGVTRLAKTFLDMSDAQKDNVAQTILYGTAMATAATAMLGAIVAAQKLQAALVGVTAAQAAATFGLSLLAAALAAAVVWEVRARMEYEKTREELIDTAESVDEYVDGLAKLRAEQSKGHSMYREAPGLIAEITEERQRGTDALDYEIEKLNELDPVMGDMTEALKIAAQREAILTEETERLAEATREAAAAAFVNLRIAWSQGAISIRESIEAMRELEATSVAVYANTAAKTRDFNQDIERMHEDKATALAKLEEGQAADIDRILAGAHARTHEKNEEALAWQRGIHAKELDDFNTLWDKKETRRTEDHNEDIRLAGEAAAERTRLAQEAKDAELAAMREAMEERLAVFAFEMLEHAGLLKIQTDQWGEVEMSAQDYYDLVQAGIIPMSGELKTKFGDALNSLVSQWSAHGEAAGESADTIDKMLGRTTTMLELVGKTDAAEVSGMAARWERNLGPEVQAVKGQVDNVTTAIGTASMTTTLETDNMRFEFEQLDYALDTTQAEVDGVGTAIEELGRVTNTVVSEMKKIVKELIAEVKELRAQIQAAIDAWKRLMDKVGGGIPSPPGGGEGENIPSVGPGYSGRIGARKWINYGTIEVLADEPGLIGVLEQLGA